MCTKPRGAVPLLHQGQQSRGTRALGRSERGGVPFVGLAVDDRHERRLAAHGQADVARGEVGVDRAPARENLLPFFVGVRLGDARRFDDPLHRHLVRELDLARFHAAGDGRGGRWFGRARQRDVPFAREQPRGRVEADPAGARQIHLAPGVEIREVVARPSRRARQRLDIGHQLDQIAGNEARGEPQMAENLHQQPRAVAAGAGSQLERLLGSLHARVEPDHVGDLLLQVAVDLHQRVDGRPAPAIDRGQPGAQTRRGRIGAQERLEVAELRRLVGEGEAFGERLEKEVERVVDGHLGDQIDLDPEQIGLVGEREPRDVVALRILLPVQEMCRRRDALRVGQDRRPAVRRRPQADELRQQLDGPVVAVLRHVTKGNVNAHVRVARYIYHQRL